MPSTTALYTAMTGLNANARAIDVIGNNIANANTTAFKSSRMIFNTLFSRTISAGSVPGDSTGGTNPHQIGLGVATAGTQRNTTGGTISSTGDQRDLAIDGKGYFVVQRGQNQLYTRAGAFRPNAENQLTTPSGERLMGFGVDDQFNVVPGRLVNLAVPVGALTLAEPTTLVRLAGNLNAAGSLPTRGASLTLGGTASAGFSAVAAAVPAPTAPNLSEPTTRLVDLEDPLLPASGTPLFAAGQSLDLRGVEKGGKSVPDASLLITDTTTLADLVTFLHDALGIDASTPNPDGATPGVALDPLTGLLQITGNPGAANDLSVESADIRLSSATGALLRYPFAPTKLAAADGESVRTTFIAYDSLGAAVELDLSIVLDSRSNTGTTWRYFVESADQAGDATLVASGSLAFDTTGHALSPLPQAITLDRSGTGASASMTFDLVFAAAEGGVTALADTSSSLAATFRDGSPIGILSTFGVGADGLITGVFSNGLTRTLGQVAIAAFNNPEGLEDVGGNAFREAPNSGTAVIAEPGAFGSGGIVGGALEQSNVDLSEEFIRLVQSSTGFSASSRIIRTADDLMQQLLALTR